MDGQLRISDLMYVISFPCFNLMLMYLIAVIERGWHRSRIWSQNLQKWNGNGCHHINLFDVRTYRQINYDSLHCRSLNEMKCKGTSINPLKPIVMFECMMYSINLENSIGLSIITIPIVFLALCSGQSFVVILVEISAHEELGCQFPFQWPSHVRFLHRNSNSMENWF